MGWVYLLTCPAGLPLPSIISRLRGAESSARGWWTQGFAAVLPQPLHPRCHRAPGNQRLRSGTCPFSLLPARLRLLRSSCPSCGRTAKLWARNSAAPLERACVGQSSKLFAICAYLPRSLMPFVPRCARPCILASQKSADQAWSGSTRLSRVALSRSAALDAQALPGNSICATCCAGAS